jgi:BirA family biotin operon repressor/biotin-[acetyl-CoA-carboxylase] ligase
MGWLLRVRKFDSVQSTMAIAHEAARDGAPEGTTVLAVEQTAGRGRRSRSWWSPRGCGLWLTTILRPASTKAQTPGASGKRGPPAALSTLSLVAGAAVWSAVQKLGASQAKLQWPNDVVAGERKLAGVLLESFEVGVESVVLVGIGLNVARRAEVVDLLPEEIHDRYVGLMDCMSTSDSASMVLATSAETVLKELEAWYDGWRKTGLKAILAMWPRADALEGIEVQAETDTGAVRGVACGLTTNGALRVLGAHGLYEICAGEIIRLTRSPGKKEKRT